MRISPVTPAALAMLALLAGLPATQAAAAGPAKTLEPSSSETFEAANAAYEAGRYEQAVELYEQLRSAGLGSAPLLYDLGNAYLRSGRLGDAIAAYRRSLALAPREADTRANLELARQSAKDALAPPQPPELASILVFWHYRLSRAELLRALLVLNLLFWATLALRLFRRGSELLRWLAAGCLLPLLACAGSLAVRHFLPARVAVVLPQEIEAHVAPLATSAVRFKLHAGSEVAAEAPRGGWVRIVLPNGERGWVPQQHVAMLVP